MKIITTTGELAEFCDAARDRPFCAIDTEFMRERTYYPILCLVQAAAEGLEAIIDPLAKGLSLDPLLALLADESVVKVFHAARQDIEIFYALMGRTPAPLFDTQIAAMAAGYGDQIGYEPLMRSLLGARIDKGSRFTDWSRRPLTEAQLNYALSDVTHLREAYPIILKRLEDHGRRHWVEEEMAGLTDPSLYDAKPEDAWRRLKLRNPKKSEIGPLMKLAEWREREAQTKDAPRNRILKDDAIHELARMRPTRREDLARARAIPKGFEKSAAGEGILRAVREGVDIPPADLPDLSSPNRPRAPSDVVDLMKTLLKRQCERYNVAPKLIASAADIEAIALDDEAGVPALKGWRREIFGEPALKLKRGEIALALENGAVTLIERG